MYIRTAAAAVAWDLDLEHVYRTLPLGIARSEKSAAPYIDT